MRHVIAGVAGFFATVLALLGMFAVVFAVATVGERLGLTEVGQFSLFLLVAVGIVGAITAIIFSIHRK